MRYKEYLLSDHWREFKQAFRESDRYNGTCEECGSVEQLEFHHITYERLGRERFEDVRVLCHPCHQSHHGYACRDEAQLAEDELDAPAVLRTLNRDAGFAMAVLASCGIEGKSIGEAFKCPLPGHGRDKPAAALWRGPDGRIWFHDFHRHSAQEWFTLGEVFAGGKYGLIGLGAGEKSLWVLRAAAETGYLTPPAMMARTLPKGTNASIVDVYDGFKRLLAIRTLYDAEQVVAPYTREFAAEWCHRSVSTCATAIKWLLDHGYLIKTQKRRWRHAGLYRLGGGNESATQEQAPSCSEPGIQPVGIKPNSQDLSA